jgi:hypothetical protein
MTQQDLPVAFGLVVLALAGCRPTDGPKPVDPPAVETPVVRPAPRFEVVSGTSGCVAF